LLWGRLPVEAEIGLLSFLSFQVVPIFVMNDSPPTFNLEGREDNLTQHSNGLGPISGASFGVGFWLNGTPFKGYVLRAVFTNYSYTYKTVDADGNPLDQVNFVERRLLGEFGSYSRIGAFIIGGTLQLGAELNKQGRCVSVTATRRIETEDCEELEIVVDDTPPGTAVNLRPSLHPAVFDFTFTLGVAF